MTQNQLMIYPQKVQKAKINKLFQQNKRTIALIKTKNIKGKQK